MIYSVGTPGPGGAVASGSSLVLPRAAAGTRGQHGTPCCAVHARYAIQEQHGGGAGEEEGTG